MRAFASNPTGRGLRLALVTALVAAFAMVSASASQAQEGGDEPCPDAGIPADQIAVQLWTFNGQADMGSVEGVTELLEALEGSGYRGIEPFGQPYDFISAEDFRELAGEHDIRVVSSHGSQNLDDFEDTVAYAVELGQDYIGAGGPPGDFSTYEETMETAEMLNTLGEIAVDGGIPGGILLHNHQHEFLTTHEDPEDDNQEKSVWQLLVENTDPDYVTFQLDVYWAAIGEHDPIELVDEYGDRITSLHVKDGDLETDTQTDLGEGDLDFKTLFETGWDDIDYYIVEADGPDDAYDYTHKAFEFLSCIELDVDDEPAPDHVCEAFQDGTTFPDSPGSGHGYFIDCLAQMGVVQGFDDGTFRPADDVTRGQLASFVVRAMETTGHELDADGDLFSDVHPGSTHGEAIYKLRNAGVIQGYPDDTFRPAEPVLRDQTARYVVNALELLLGDTLPTSDARFPDVTFGEYVEDIDKLVTAEIVSGFTDGTFGPRESVTRGQMTRFIGNTLDTYATSLTAS